MDKKPSFLSNIIAAIGFFFLVIILIWGLINITRWAPSLLSSISSLFGGVGKTLIVSIDPVSVQSGNKVNISWEHKASKGTYAFTYDCTNTAIIDVPTAEGGYTTLPCGNSYVTSVSSAKAIQVIPQSNATSTHLPISVTYRNDKGVSGASGQGVITITNPTPPTSTTTPPTNGGGTTPPPTSGTPDLSTRLLGFGVMLNGVLTPVSQFNQGDTLAIKFEIKNVGTKSTGPWKFRANLPTNPASTYNSVTQQSLAPGDRIEYTLKFTNPAHGIGVITVKADSQNSVNEISETNNTISYQLTLLP